jgi:hypothetical protein
MRLTNDLTFNAHPVFGSQPELFHGTDRPDTGSTFTTKARGSHYYAALDDNQYEHMVKVKDDGRADDWAILEGVIVQRITAATMTDGGGATGTVVLNATIPAGAYVYRSLLTTLTDFVGSAAVTITVGDGSDVDRYNTGTPSLATTAVMLDLGVTSGEEVHIAAVSTVTVTITDDSDFGDLVAGGGAVTVSIWYYGVNGAA